MTAILATILQDQPLQNSTPPYMTDATIWNHMSGALNQSFYRVVTLLIAILPGLLAFAVALVLFTLIGMAVSAILRRGLTWLRFDDRIAKMRGDANWTPSSTPTAIVARVSFWANVLLGLVIGVSAFDTSYATAAVLPISLLPYLTRSVGAILLLIAGNLVARFLARTVLIGAVNAQLQYARFLALGVKWMVLVLTAAMVLEHLEIGGAVVELAFGILFGGIVLTLALAIGLGSRDLVSRSLESRVERVGENAADPGAAPATSAESIQHF